MEPNRNPKQNHRDVQTSKTINQTTNGTTTTILFEGFKLETPRPNKQYSQLNYTKPQVDWHRQVDTSYIQLIQLTTEQDSTPQNPTDSDNGESPRESNYKLLRDAPHHIISRHHTNNFVRYKQHTRNSHHKNTLLQSRKTSPFG